MDAMMTAFLVAVLLLFAHSTTSHKIMKKETIIGAMKEDRFPFDIGKVTDDDHCIWPGGCHLKTDQCSFEIGQHDITFDQFWKDYVMKDRPVIWKGGIYRVKEFLEASKAFSLDKLLFDVNFNSVELSGHDSEEDDKPFRSLQTEVWRLIEAEKHASIERRDGVGVLSSEVQEHSGVRDMYREPSIFSKHDIFGRMNVFLRRLGVDPGWHEGYFIIGPTGGGTSLHVDFLHTSFWNACFAGGKQFLVFGKDFENQVASKTLEEWGDLGTPEWFEQVYPRLDELGITYDECHQSAGDLVWVPHGRWHITMNTHLSITISHNQILTPLKSQFEGAMSYMCFDRNHQEEENPIESSIHWCFALRFIKPSLYEQSCCNTDKFRTLMDKETATHELFASNTEYYDWMMAQVGPLSMCRSLGCYLRYNTTCSSGSETFSTEPAQCPANLLMYEMF